MLDSADIAEKPLDTGDRKIFDDAIPNPPFLSPRNCHRYSSDSRAALREEQRFCWILRKETRRSLGLPRMKNRRVGTTKGQKHADGSFRRGRRLKRSLWLSFELSTDE